MALSDELVDVMREGRRRHMGASDPLRPGLRDWLVNGTAYQINSIGAKRLDTVVIGDAWSEANGADCQRFFWAARDSIVPKHSPICDRKSIGWSAVQTYYTAFYLLSGFLRVFGRGVSYLSRDDCTAISSRSTTVAMQPGLYEISITYGASIAVSLEKANGSGYHEFFWHYVDRELDKLSQSMAVGAGMFSAFSPQHLQVAILDVVDLRSRLGMTGSANRSVGWMSALRNELNYRLARRTWSPTYRDDGVEIVRLREDVVSIIRGAKQRLGGNLRLDADVRAMIDRVAVLYRDFQAFSGVRNI